MGDGGSATDAAMQYSDLARTFAEQGQLEAARSAALQALQLDNMSVEARGLLRYLDSVKAAARLPVGEHQRAKLKPATVYAVQSLPSAPASGRTQDRRRRRSNRWLAGDQEGSVRPQGSLALQQLSQSGDRRRQSTQWLSIVEMRRPGSATLGRQWSAQRPETSWMMLEEEPPGGVDTIDSLATRLGDLERTQSQMVMSRRSVDAVPDGGGTCCASTQTTISGDIVCAATAAANLRTETEEARLAEQIANKEAEEARHAEFLADAELRDVERARNVLAAATKQLADAKVKHGSSPEHHGHHWLHLDHTVQELQKKLSNEQAEYDEAQKVGTDYM